MLGNSIMFYFKMGTFSISQNMWDLLCLCIHYKCKGGDNIFLL